MVVCVYRGSWADTWYVDGAVKKPGDGTSWQEALKTIQSGIGTAGEGDTVIVAEGTYVENIHFEGKNIVLRSTNPTDWKVVANTIIDGNQAGSVVTFAATEDETCILAGFTIRNGRARDGGGILGGTEDTHTHAAIRNNLITKNISTGSTSDMRGGGGVAYCDGLIENNTISENSAYQAGGVHVCAGTIRNNIIADNSATTWAGGLAGCSGIIENNLVIGNTAQLDGGIGWCNGIIRNCTICGNSAVVHGGGIAHWAPTIENCIIWGNTADINPQLHETGVPSYCCIQDWTGGGTGNITTIPRFVDVDGEDNDPETYEDNDYRLLADSPCIDRGMNEEWMEGALDLDGNPRVACGCCSLTVDMGAYEMRFPLRIVASGEGGMELRWEARSKKRYVIFSCSDVSNGAWAEEADVSPGGGATSWTDSSVLGRAKFYRIEIE
jgi:hypothetical protein